jgi:hypothetical protein
MNSIHVLSTRYGSQSPAPNPLTLATCFVRPTDVYPASDRSSSGPLISRVEISYDSTPYDSDARPVCDERQHLRREPVGFWSLSGLSTKALAASLHCGDAGANALPDQSVFELSYAEHCRHRPAVRVVRSNAIWFNATTDARRASNSFSVAKARSQGHSMACQPAHYSAPCSRRSRCLYSAAVGSARVRL